MRLNFKNLTFAFTVGIYAPGVLNAGFLDQLCTKTHTYARFLLRTHNPTIHITKAYFSRLTKHDETYAKLKELESHVTLKEYDKIDEIMTQIVMSRNPIHISIANLVTGHGDIARWRLSDLKKESTCSFTKEQSRILYNRIQSSRQWPTLDQIWPLLKPTPEKFENSDH